LWLSPGQAANVTGFSVATIRNWLKDGLPSRENTENGYRYILESDLREYIETKNSKPRNSAGEREPVKIKAYQGSSSPYTSIEDIAEFDSRAGTARRLAVGEKVLRSMISENKLTVFTRWDTQFINVRQAREALSGKQIQANPAVLDSGIFLPIKEYVDRFELATYEGAWISEGCQSGEIANHRVGNIRLVSVRDSKRYIDKRRKQNSPLQ
jgi:hypothetical protein